MTRWSCWSCRWSQGHISGRLLCTLDGKEAVKVCRRFEYEPGSDESQRRA